MDDDCKEYKRNKQQQRLYKPGSGPLRRSCYGFDTKMDTYSTDIVRREKYHNHYGSQNSVNDVNVGNRDHSAANMRQKKPEQQLYVAKSSDYCPDTDRLSIGPTRGHSTGQYNSRRAPNDSDKSYNSSTGKHSRGASRRDRKFENISVKEGPSSDLNYNRSFRQTSETRSISPSRYSKEQNSLDRNRDSRSMETSGGRHSSMAGGKPPSGRRNSAGYVSDTSRPKYTVNLDNIPPRFRKKYLEQSGHYSSKSVDQIHRDNHMSNPSIPPSSQEHYNSPGPNWSQTLPSRGRGRLRDSESFDREKFMNNYLRRNHDQHSRKSTPSGSYANLYDGHAFNNLHINEKTGTIDNNMDSQREITESASLNGISMRSNTASGTQMDPQKQESDNDHDISLQVQNHLNLKMSSSRGLKNNEKKPERNRKDSTASVHIEHEIIRKDSNVSIPYDSIPPNIRNRERRDSHRSNRSSTLGNSRDDLDRWRSLRSYSREQSSEGRDGSTNRATSPRDNDGFRVPSAVSRSAALNSSNQSPTPSAASVEPGAGGGLRRAKRRSGRKRSRASDAHPPPTAPAVPHAPPAPQNSSAPMNWREEILATKGSHDKQEPGHQRNRLNSTVSEKSNPDSGTPHPGLILLPQSAINHLQKDTNPSKVDMRMEQVKESSSRGGQGYEATDAARAARHRTLLQEVDRADAILQTHSIRGPLSLADHWQDADNIEHHFWKILYYNFIEVLRKSFTQIPLEDKPKIVKLINTIIEEGNIYFENLVQMLEKTYKFNIDDYINDNHILPPKGLGYLGLALISVQKLYVFLGDLARYKEQRRKLDAVYYYMRSLMSSNPFHSARESLLSLDAVDANSAVQGNRREVWVRASGHRTTTPRIDPQTEQLAAMSSVESFHECASQMLRQFRALLHRKPLPTPSARLLQLTALNMFAVESSAASLKDKNSNGERSGWLECALGVSLLMFGALLERCCALLPEPADTQQHTDALLLLPAIKTEDLEDDDSASASVSGPASLSEGSVAEGADALTRRLLRRKELLETRKATLDRQRERVQAIAGAPSQPYLFAVPLVVITELEGLQKCSRVGGNASAALSWVAGAGAGVRLATSLGSLLASRAFTDEREQLRSTNDDKVLATALNLHANLTAADSGGRRGGVRAARARGGAADGRPQPASEGAGGRAAYARPALLRAVGRLARCGEYHDRNLRVKALAAELPTRDLPSFVQWAGLHAAFAR
ncbi:putative Telomerase-binding protein EST1A [Operophtera brumata]|uniref:Putative Telomerase-binding protein EST1A n=1 Tax=Operophtera brumata TaxID=104452 RepID=A0A0L7LJR3_OPEBR|nr:putative Telomerase-binding protein EST1A [Operophtera brumata]